MVKNITEIRAAIAFGKEYIEWCKEKGEKPADFAYDRLLELYEELAEALSIGG